MCIQSASKTQSKLPPLSFGDPLLRLIAGAFKHRSTMFFHQVLLPSGLSQVIWQADFRSLTLPVLDVPVLFSTWWTGLPSAWPSLSLLPTCYQLHEFFSSLGVFIPENYRPVGLFPGLLGHSTPFLNWNCFCIKKDLLVDLCPASTRDCSSPSVSSESKHSDYFILYHNTTIYGRNVYSTQIVQDTFILE